MALYDAFISYSHAQDRAVAAALQSVVQALGKPWYRRRELRIFRDDTSLSATPHLWPSIEQALSQSRFLILLASPEAAASRWVDKEAKYWLDHQSSDTFLIALTSGELAWDDAASDFVRSSDAPLPPALTGRFPSEPKWVDLRDYRAAANKGDPAFMALAADFAAAVRGMPKEDLLSEEVRQQRRNVAWAGAAAAIMLLLAIGAGVAAWQAVNQRDRALATLAAATESANGLVVHVAGKVRRTTGIPVDLQSDILDRTRALQEKLIDSWQANARLERSEAIVRRELAQTFLLLGEAAPALESAVKSRQIMEELLTADPQNRELRRELSRSYNRIGDAQMDAGRYPEALAAFSEALRIRKELAAMASDNELKRELGLSHERTGNALFLLGKCGGNLDAVECEQARDAFRNSFDIRDALARAEPDNSERMGDLAYGYERLGWVEVDPQKRLAALTQCLAIRKRLVAKEPNDAFWQRDLAATHDRVGDAHLRDGQREKAIEAFSESLRLREKLAASNPEAARWNVPVAYSLFHLAQVDDRPGDRRDHYRRALKILKAFQGKLTASDDRLRDAIDRQLAVLDSDSQ